MFPVCACVEVTGYNGCVTFVVKMFSNREKHGLFVILGSRHVGLRLVDAMGAGVVLYQLRTCHYESM